MIIEVVTCDHYKRNIKSLETGASLASSLQKTYVCYLVLLHPGNFNGYHISLSIQPDRPK